MEVLDLDLDKTLGSNEILELIDKEEIRTINLVNAVKKMTKKFPVVNVNFFGYMGTGKTNAAKYLAKNLENKFKVYYAQAPEPGDAVDAINKIRGRRILIILDDLSFKYHGRSKELREFENTITRIRHIVGAEKVILVLIYHYLRAILPFMRIAQIHVLFSITQTEVEMYSEIFRPRYLYYFYKLYDELIWGNVKDIDFTSERPVLIKAMTRHAVSKIPLINDYEFSNNLTESYEQEKEDETDWRDIASALYMFLHLRYKVPKEGIKHVLRKILGFRFGDKELYDLMKRLDAQMKGEVEGGDPI